MIQIHHALYIKLFYVRFYQKMKINTDSDRILEKNNNFFLQSINEIEMIRLCTNTIHNLGPLVTPFVFPSI